MKIRELLALSVCAGAASAQAITFENNIVTTNVDGSRSASAADFDGDGDIDMVAVDTENGIYYWYENTGDNAT
ncbi:MAG: VCBS repeat-containing protein [Planctomycetota bacterium]